MLSASSTSTLGCFTTQLLVISVICTYTVRKDLKISLHVTMDAGRMLHLTKSLNLF
jgi:hypothetical protein